MNNFNRLSFEHQFRAVGALVVILFAWLIGANLSQEIESTAVQRAADIVSSYTLGMLDPILAKSDGGSRSEVELQAMLDKVFQTGPLKQKVRRVKLWQTDGRIVYSTEPSLIGQRFPLDESLNRALTGQVVAHLATLEDQKHGYEKGLEPDLLEVYVPVSVQDAQAPRMVVELYHTTQDLREFIQRAIFRVWVLVAVASLLAYTALHLTVRRASQTIEHQRRTLQGQLMELQESLAENRQMKDDMAAAGTQASALSEEMLQRVAAEIHDGPAQQLAFALMRLESVAHDVDPAQRAQSAGVLPGVRTALASSLIELRHIARYMALPGLEDRRLGDLVHRCVSRFRQMTGVEVQIDVRDDLLELGLPQKQVLYRCLQEGLSNAYKHAQGRSIQVRVQREADQVRLIVRDQGPGLAGHREQTSTDAMGLRFLRERLKLLGGRMELLDRPDGGAMMQIHLPL